MIFPLQQSLVSLLSFPSSFFLDVARASIDITSLQWSFCKKIFPFTINTGTRKHHNYRANYFLNFMPSALTLVISILWRLCCTSHSISSPSFRKRFSRISYGFRGCDIWLYNHTNQNIWLAILVPNIVTGIHTYSWQVIFKRTTFQLEQIAP